MGPAPSRRKPSTRKVKEENERLAQGPVPYEEMRFKQKINKAINEMEVILDTTRHPRYPSEIHHQYVCILNVVLC
jgi:hypothetical protein